MDLISSSNFVNYHCSIVKLIQLIQYQNMIENYNINQNVRL